MIRTESDAYAPNAMKKSAVACVPYAKPIRALAHRETVTAGNVITRSAHRGTVNLRCDANVRVATRGSVGLVRNTNRQCSDTKGSESGGPISVLRDTKFACQEQ